MIVRSVDQSWRRAVACSGLNPARKQQQTTALMSMGASGGGADCRVPYCGEGVGKAASLPAALWGSS